MTSNQAAAVFAQLDRELLLNFTRSYEENHGHLNGVLAHLTGTFNLALEVAEHVLAIYLEGKGA